MLKVDRPGIYGLRVQDEFGCIGSDTTVVNLKNGCITGIFVPTAFTPDGDGKNDVFKPLVYENLKQYNFTVFNRWGTLVFQSKTAGEGWNGAVAGVKQDSGIFIWKFSYQKEGEPLKLLSGTVALIRP